MAPDTHIWLGLLPQTLEKLPLWHASPSTCLPAWGSRSEHCVVEILQARSLSLSWNCGTLERLLSVGDQLPLPGNETLYRVLCHLNDWVRSVHRWPGAESPTSPSVSQKNCFLQGKISLTGVSLQAIAGVKNQLSGRVVSAEGPVQSLLHKLLKPLPGPRPSLISLLWSLPPARSSWKVGL